MAEFEYFAPAKINLSLRVRPPDRSGYHPLRSLTQTIEFGDTLEADPMEEDRLTIVGAELPDGGENLVWKAFDALGGSRHRLDVTLTKHTPIAAGMGGGSSDAAAALRLGQELLRLPDDVVFSAAPEVGADVTYFLTGGSAWMEGYGEIITPIEPLSGFAVAVAVPDFELATPDVYRRWDTLEFPTGQKFPERGLPPPLRTMGDFFNDLTPAALAVEPALGDWMVDLADRWERPVALSGSGPSVYGFFADLDEARSAIDAAPGDCRACFAADLRDRGVERMNPAAGS
jgi:4-diphosphocytidyl-2-C-methyl-D-erythritol kinase